MNSSTMSELNQIIDSLESKFAKLTLKLENLENENKKLMQEISELKVNNRNLLDAKLSLQAQYDSIKLANSLLGSEENKRETKLKINSLIREIDHCIAQLSE